MISKDLIYMLKVSTGVVAHDTKCVILVLCLVCTVEDWCIMFVEELRRGITLHSLLGEGIKTLSSSSNS